MEKTRPLHRGFIIGIGRIAILVVAVIACLLIGALSLNAHDDGLLAVAALCALAVVALSVVGVIWTVRSIRALLKAPKR